MEELGTPPPPPPLSKGLPLGTFQVLLVLDICSEISDDNWGQEIGIFRHKRKTYLLYY